MGKKNVLEET